MTDLQRATRRVRDALPGLTDTQAEQIAALDLAIRQTMDEPR